MKKRDIQRMALVIVFIALAAGVGLYALTMVWSANNEVALLQACMAHASSHFAGCPNIPYSPAEVTNLKNEAGAFSDVGWGALAFGWLAFFGGLLDYIF